METASLHTELRQLCSHELYALLDQICADAGYLEDRQTTKWAAISNQIGHLIRKIATDVFHCDMQYKYRSPFDETATSLADMIASLAAKLESSFSQYPPYTVLRLAELLTLRCSCIQIPASADAVLEKKNDPSFVTVDKNLISGDETRTDSVNNYHRKSMDDVQLIRLNDVYAVRFLSYLKSVVYVQSTSSRVLDDLVASSSPNIIGSKGSKVAGQQAEDANDDDDDDADKSDYPVKLEKIPWLSEQHQPHQQLNTTINMDDDEDTEESNDSTPEIQSGTVLFRIKGDVITENNLAILEAAAQSSPKRISNVNHDERVVKRTRSFQKLPESTEDLESETSISSSIEPSSPPADIDTSLEKEILDSPKDHQDTEVSC